MAKELSLFGDLTSFGDPNWYQGWHSPYYHESHIALRLYVRNWVEKNVAPFTHEWDEDKKVPMSLFKSFASSGILPLTLGKIPSTVPFPLACNLTEKTFDPFHELVMMDELSRCASGGVLWALLEGTTIGLPPLLHFGSPWMQSVIQDCLKGEKVICLAITEPSAGSDVANIQTSAVLQGDHYIVNGIKKWITNAVYADYFTVAVRTGGKGASGLSLLLLEKSMPGIKTVQMKCSGVWSSGTTLLSFDNVKVPVRNIIGKNHERFGLSIQALRFARVCLEEAILHSSRRETFGKKLIEHPVIRNKLAHMARHVESTHAYLEQITYQMCKNQNWMELLGGPIALLKVQTTLTFELCARESAQIFGGLAYTRGGLGAKVERLYREVRPYAIGGGSEEIMLDMAIRQARKSEAQLQQRRKNQDKLNSKL